MFFSVNPTVWTICHIAAAHTENMRQLYGMGLGLNSMEGREAKHVFISKYSENTLPQNRWEQIFRHKYVSLLWLRERGYNQSSPTAPNQSYIPQRVTNDAYFCFCGMRKESASEDTCWYCSHPLRETIKVSVTEGRNMLIN